MKTYPIFIPSKTRLYSKTALWALGSSLDFKLVVEPAEASAYRGTWGSDKVIVLPKSGQGIAYVRNFIHELNKKDWYWMLDDDITGFYLSDEGKTNRRLMVAVLQKAQRLFEKEKRCGQGALEYQQYSWSAKKDQTTNGYCDVAVAIHGGRTRKIKYRAEVNLKEDRDFTLQILYAGMTTMRASRCAFSAPKNGSNKGGLYDVYRANKEAAASQRMVDLWGPEICTLVTKKDGRPDVKINWRHFK